MIALGEAWLPSVAGLIIGAALGYIARTRQFCTIAALERHWYAGDSGALRTWVLAAASAIAFTQLLVALGWIDLRASFYLEPVLGLGGAALGGLLFGIGMALVGACGFTALVLLGGGSLRALIVLVVMALTALSAERGLLALARTSTVDRLALDLGFVGQQSLPALASSFTGLDLYVPTVLLVLGALLVWIARDAAFRADRAAIATGLAVGGLVTAGWLVTSLAAQALVVPVRIEAASFVDPVARLLFHLTVATGEAPSYAVGVVVGVALGAAAAAWHRHDVRWEACDDARELGRHLLGAALMGLAGVLAHGCTIGQGVSAASTLAASVPIVMAAMILGARLGLALMIEGSLRGLRGGAREARRAD